MHHPRLNPNSPPLPGNSFIHPRLTRRTMLQAGGIGLLGLGSGHLAALHAEQQKTAGNNSPAARSVIFIFLSGGLAQHESFDMKPHAPENIRGEFQPISTNTTGLQICEHLPLLAQRSHLWSVLRSLTHHSNDHSAGHHIMLTGRSLLPPGFNPSSPLPTDWPSIASLAATLTRPRNNLPPAIVLPEKLVHSTGRVIPGQFSGILGPTRDPWFLEAASFDAKSYGAFPEYGFDHADAPHSSLKRKFEIPSLSLPQGILPQRMERRLGLLDYLDHQRAALESTASASEYDRFQSAAVSLLMDRRVRQAFDVAQAPAADLERYGRNCFGWSILMAARLVEAGVNLVQVNLGNDETWDTHGHQFPHLKDKLFPPTDRAVCALLDDLQERGLLDSTLVVIAGEFGRTPRVTIERPYYTLAGRGHWGAAQSVLFAGGGIQGGRIIGSTDPIGAYPNSEPHTPEDFAATIYSSLGLPDHMEFHDQTNRVHPLYQGQPIRNLF